MKRADAIQHIWGLSISVAGEFCCGRQEEKDLWDKTTEALRTLGVTDAELDV